MESGYFFCIGYNAKLFEMKAVEGLVEINIASEGKKCFLFDKAQMSAWFVEMADSC